MIREQKSGYTWTNEIMMKKDDEFQLHKDKEAVYSYFVDYVNKNTVFFHNLKENGLSYRKWLLYKFLWYVHARTDKRSLQVGLFKNSDSLRLWVLQSSIRATHLKMTVKEDFFERYEDRIAIVSLYLAQGNVDKAKEYAQMLINQEYQPATPTFLNSGKKRSGELVSCFLDEMGDNLSGIGYIFDSAMKLSSIEEGFLSIFPR